MTDEYRNLLVKDLYELEVNCNICIEELADDITEDCKKFYQQGRADAIDEVSIRVKALELLLDWSKECGFGLDSFPNEYEQYKHTLSDDMSYTDMMIKIAECVIAEQLKEQKE